MDNESPSESERWRADDLAERRDQRAARRFWRRVVLLVLGILASYAMQRL